MDTFDCTIHLWVIWQCAEFLDVQIDAHLIQDGIAELSPLVRQSALGKPIMSEVIVVQALSNVDCSLILNLIGLDKS